MTTRQETTKCKSNRKAAEAKAPKGTTPPNKMDFRPQHLLELAHHKPSSTLVRDQHRLETTISKSSMGQKMRRTPPIQKTIKQRRSTSTAQRSLYRWVLQVIWTRRGTDLPPLSSKQTQKWAGQSHHGTAVEVFLAASSAVDLRTEGQTQKAEGTFRNQRNGFRSCKETLMPMVNGQAMA